MTRKTGILDQGAWRRNSNMVGGSGSMVGDQETWQEEQEPRWKMEELWSRAEGSENMAR
jgi:hypothetical protein